VTSAIILLASRASTVIVIRQNIFELICATLFATVWEPALSFLGFAGNHAPFSIGNCAPKIATTIVLVTLRRTVISVRKFELLNQPEILCAMFFTTV